MLRVSLTAAILSLLGCAAAHDVRPAPVAAPGGSVAPKLVVVCVFDQMCGDTLEKFAPAFGEDGFRRLLREGTRWTECHYPYAITETGPGHATIGSGRLPVRHGIVANEWFDVTKRRTVYNVEDSDAKLVGAAGEAPGLGMSPRNFEGLGLGDLWQAQGGPGGRVVSVSTKDRSAILMGGRKPTAAYWFCPPAGSFVTSTYYAPRVPGWFAEFGATRTLEALPSTWHRSVPEEIAARFDRDDAPWETGRAGMGSAFPHPLDGKESALDRWDAINTSPVSLNMVTDLVLELIDREELGQRDRTDLLFVSWSSTDYVGHWFGQDSVEALEIWAAADADLARLLTHLDRVVGPGRTLVALTSDHGVSEVPERILDRGGSGGRVHYSVDGDGYAKDDLALVESALSAKLGRRPGRTKRWSAYVTDADFFLDRRELEVQGVALADASTALRDVLRTMPFVESAWTRDELLAGVADPRAKAVALSCRADRSGDVLYVLKPGYLTGRIVATHGTPHRWDRWVPLLLAGPGIPRGRRVSEPVSPADLAPTLAARFGIPAAGAAFDGRPLPGLEPIAESAPAGAAPSGGR